MKIAVIGAGYVGLVTAACLAEWGNDVVCVDKNPETIRRLKAGEIPIYEPGLGELVAANGANRRLTFVTDISTAVPGAQVVFIAVGTPQGAADGEADLSFVREAAREIAQHLTGDLVVVDKSTVPVGTGDEVEGIIRGLRPDVKIAVVSNPEFLREGEAVGDFLEPDRVVLGVEDATAERLMKQLYAPIAEARRPVFITGRRTAELIKYASNAFLATKITMINELADLCEAAGADVTELATAVGLDHRIGRDFLHAGPGFGGSCFPKDTQALLHTAHEYGVPLRIIESTVAGNNARKRRMVLKVLGALDVPVNQARIAVLGLTFKANTDDLRESPSIPLIKALRRLGATISAFDPKGATRVRDYLPDLEVLDDPYVCATGADVAVLMTQWEAVRQIDLDHLRAVMKRPVLVDLQNIFPPDLVRAHGFTLVGVGRAVDDTHPHGATGVLRAQVANG